LFASPYFRTSSDGNELKGNETKEKLLSDFAIAFTNSDSAVPCFTPLATSVTKTFERRLSRVSFRVAALSEDAAAVYLVSLNFPFSSR